MTFEHSSEDSAESVDEIVELQLIASGDQAAFERLYVRYHPKLYRFIQGQLNNPAQVEEAVSDTLYAVWTGAEKFKNQSKVSTWIFGIGFRTAMKAIRSDSRHSRYSGNAEEIDSLVDTNSSNDPATGASLLEEANRLVSALDSISPEQRAVVELTALGWSSAEIAEIVDCPSNTVKTRMFHARKKLMRVLGTAQN